MSKQAFSRPVGLSTLAFSLAMGLVSGPTLAQSDRLMVDVGPCVDIPSTLERFECYESRVAAARGTGSSAGSTAPQGPAETTIQPPSSSRSAERAQRNARTADNDTVDEDSFGLQEQRREEREKEKQQELRSTIAGLEETVPNSHIITLENGQVWRQMRPERYRIEVGHDVRIYPSPFGSSFRLSADDLRGFIQVERIK